MSKTIQVIIIALFSIIFFSISFFSAKRESLTYDEIVYLQEGIITLKDHKFANFDTINPPLIRHLATIPYIFGNKDNVLNNISLNKMMPARIVVILLSILLLILVYIAAKLYFGTKAALFSLFLFIFEPNILANNHYFTLDIGLTLFFFLSFLLFIKVLKKPSLSNFYFFGISLGLAMSTKVITIFYLLFIIPSILILKFKKQSFNWLFKNKRYIILSLLLCLFVVWGTYFFTSDVLIAKRNDPNRVSSKLLKSAISKNNKIIESTIYLAQNQKIPLGNYLALIKNTIIRSRQENNTFFMGKFYSKNEWYFTPVNILYKTSLPLLILILISMYLFLKGKTQKDKYLLFLIPITFILIFSAFSSMNSWVRYLLPLYPFLIIISSTSIKFFNSGYLRLVFVVICLWYSYTALAYFPHFISFANELSGERSKRFEKFIDSNIDWGQGLFDFKNYIDKKHPKSVTFSYFGRDNGDIYGLKSDYKYGSHKFEDICRFHKISNKSWTGNSIKAISISNWYYCGYYKSKEYPKKNIVDVVGDSILIFK